MRGCLPVAGGLHSMSSLGTMMEFPLTLDHLLVRAERMFPAVPVVSRLPDRSLHRTTYRAGRPSRAGSSPRRWRRAGLTRGDRVATLMWNHAAHLETYLGVPLAGGVVHTLNLRLSPEELAFIIGHAHDRFLLVDEVLLPLWEKVRPRVSIERWWWCRRRRAASTRRCSRPRPAMDPTAPRRGRPVRHVLHVRHHRAVQGRGVHAPQHAAAHGDRRAAGRAVHPARGRSHAGGAHVPRQRLGPALRLGDDGSEGGVPRAGARRGERARISCRASA